MLLDTTGSESKSTLTVLQEVRSPSIRDDARVMSVLINHPPGAPGYPPHRLPGGPGFGYMIDGEMLFEIEGEAPRVLRAGDAFWGAGGDVIHYQDANLHFSRDLFGSDVVRAGRRVGLIVPDGHGRSAGVARGRAFHGRWGPRVGWRVSCCSGEGGPKSLPSFGYRGGPAPGGVDA